MNQREAVDIVYKLLPEISNGDPSTILTKYAADKQLSPAQLERLGHVFNTASTLTTLEKDAASTPFLLDVPKMTEAYVKVCGKAKKAASIFDEGIQKAAAACKCECAPGTPCKCECETGVESEEEEPEGEDEAEMETETEDDSAEMEDEAGMEGEVPDVWSGKEPKSKAKKANHSAPVKDSKQIFWMGMKVAHAALDEYAMRMQDYTGEVYKVARWLEKQAEPAQQLAVIRQDIFSNISPEASHTFANKLASYLSSSGINVVEPEVKNVILARDRTGQLSNFKNAWESLKEATVAASYLEDALEAVVTNKEAMAMDMHASSAIRKLSHELDLAGYCYNLVKVANSLPKLNSDQWGRDLDKVITDLAKKREEARPGQEDALAAGAAGLGAVQLADKTLQGIGRTLGQDIPNIWGQALPGGRASDIMDTIWGKDNRRKVENAKLDEQRIVEDTKSMAALQKLMISDEELSTKDPEKVFEAFQTIRRASPEVASDTSLLRLLLRQALATQGVDIDTANVSRKFEFGAYKPENNPTWGTSQPVKREENIKTF